MNKLTWAVHFYTEENAALKYLGGYTDIPAIPLGGQVVYFGAAPPPYNKCWKVVETVLCPDKALVDVKVLPIRDIEFSKGVKDWDDYRA